jgi:hypothetical protein
MLEFLGLFG